MLNFPNCQFKVTPQLTLHVAALPLVAGDAYVNFIRRFGTHYTTTVVMGAKFLYQSEVI